ncbi:MAG: PcfJ domain-containing protein [Spirochaetota bacterium]
MTSQKQGIFADLFLQNEIADHFGTLGHNKKNRKLLKRLLVHISECSDLLQVEEGARYTTLTEAKLFLMAIKNLVLRKDLHLQSPLEWPGLYGSKRVVLESLLRFALGKYQVPLAMTSIWTEAFSSESMQLQTLYTQVSCGMSLRKLNPPLSLARKMERFFLDSPGHLTFMQALRWAQVRGLGGNESLAREILDSNLGLLPERDEFHQSVILYFANHQAAIKMAEVGPLVDYINFAKYEAKSQWQHWQANFSLKGRKLDSLRKAMQAWHESLRYSPRQMFHFCNAVKWKATGMEAFEYIAEKEGALWTITEVLSSDELYQEGKAMHHCVSSYLSSCLNGKTSIWSLRCNGLRVLTLEVIPKSRKIQQIRGLANRRATMEELKIVALWKRMEGLQGDLK